MNYFVLKINQTTVNHFYGMVINKAVDRFIRNYCKSTLIDSKYRDSPNYGFKLLHIDCCFGIHCIIDFISVGTVCINQKSINISAAKCYMAFYEIGQLNDV